MTTQLNLFTRNKRDTYDYNHIYYSSATVQNAYSK